MKFNCYNKQIFWWKANWVNWNRLYKVPQMWLQVTKKICSILFITLFNKMYILYIPMSTNSKNELLKYWWGIKISFDSGKFRFQKWIRLEYLNWIIFFISDTIKFEMRMWHFQKFLLRLCNCSRVNFNTGFRWARLYVN